MMVRFWRWLYDRARAALRNDYERRKNGDHKCGRCQRWGFEKELIGSAPDEWKSLDETATLLSFRCGCCGHLTGPYIDTGFMGVMALVEDKTGVMDATPAA